MAFKAQSIDCKRPGATIKECDCCNAWSYGVNFLFTRKEVWGERLTLGYLSGVLQPKSCRIVEDL